ncbi:hypothetical protein D3C87_1401780 [compost metagenome]
MVNPLKHITKDLTAYQMIVSGKFLKIQEDVFGLGPYLLAYICLIRKVKNSPFSVHVMENRFPVHMCPFYLKIQNKISGWVLRRVLN